MVPIVYTHHNFVIKCPFSCNILLYAAKTFGRFANKYTRSAGMKPRKNEYQEVHEITASDITWE